MAELIRVGMADYKVGKSPATIISYGLGSCIGISLYDPQTKVGGATLTKLLGTSAWYAPGAAAAAMVEAIALDAKKLIPCCVYLDGEYGEKDLCIGVPVLLGKNGVEKIVEYKLDGDEKAKFDESVQAARNTNAKLNVL